MGCAGKTVPVLPVRAGGCESAVTHPVSFYKTSRLRRFSAALVADDCMLSFPVARVS